MSDMERFEELLKECLDASHMKGFVIGCGRPTVDVVLQGENVKAARSALVAFVRERLSTSPSAAETCTCREKSDYVHPTRYCQFCGALTGGEMR